MIITRSRRLVINATQYESIDVSATVQFDPEELDPADGDPALWADKYLTELLEPEMAEAATVTTNRKSLINEYRYTETDTETK